MNYPQVILWDFDGVIMNSNDTRDQGFYKVLSNFPDEEVEALMQFHRDNGGLSRYVKFRYFFEVVRKETVTDSIIQLYASKFSEIMLSELTNKALLIQETIRFIEKNHQGITMFIVSGSDQEELRRLCRALDIHFYFKEIFGSPTTKIDNVSTIIKTYNYNPANCLLIGDSINDYDAASLNGIPFMGYNSVKAEALSQVYLPLS